MAEPSEEHRPGGNQPAEPGTPSGPRPRRRDYEKVLAALETRWKRHPPDRARRMHEIVEGLWDMFGGRVFSWVGFYFPSPDGRQLTLGHNQDKPACSPISSKGVCGKAVELRASQIVKDVKTLGDAYVQCDPQDRSEIAVPVIGDDGKVFAVLDVDSREVGAFDEEDRRWLERIVKGLSQSPAPNRP